jgi:Na+/melibiose symporter-like transporter
MLSLYALFMAPRGFSGVYLFGWLAAMYLGTSIVGLAHSAWAATLTRHYNDRSRLFSLITATGVLGTMVALAILIGAPALGKTDAQGVQAAGWFIIALVPATVLLAAVRTPEPIPANLTAKTYVWRDYWEVLTKPDLLRLFLAQIALTLGPGWMSAIYLFFFKASRGFTTQQASILLAVYILAGLPGALLTAALARRIGKHRAMMVTTTAFSLGLFSIFIVPKANLLLSLPTMIWEGAMASGFGLLVSAMLADVGDEVRLNQGKQRISLLYSVNALAAKLAAAAAIYLTFRLLPYLGFNPAEGAVNTAAAIRNLDTTFLAGPIVFVMLGGACMIGWRLDARRHGEIRASLDARDAALVAAEGG